MQFTHYCRQGNISKIIRFNEIGPGRQTAALSSLQWELEVPVEPHTEPKEQTILAQTNKDGLGRQPLPTAHSRNLPPESSL